MPSSIREMRPRWPETCLREAKYEALGVLTPGSYCSLLLDRKVGIPPTDATPLRRSGLRDARQVRILAARPNGSSGAEVSRWCSPSLAFQIAPVSLQAIDYRLDCASMAGPEQVVVISALTAR